MRIVVAAIAAWLLQCPVTALAQPPLAAAAPIASPEIPSIEQRLPELWGFLRRLERDIATGRLRSTDALIAEARTFYSPERMAGIEQVIAGWQHMASFDDGKTLWHVNVAMVALLTLDEYRGMPPAERIVQEWIVLLHDLAKEPIKGRDHRHSFRSGALAGRILPSLGFPVTASYAADMPQWFALTDGATRQDKARGYPVHDNSKLPAIMTGAERIFSGPTLTAVKAITLHQSITSLAAWPVAAPISRQQAAAYVDPALFPALLALTLADSGGWNLFSPSKLTAMYEETRARFAPLAP